MLKQLLSAALLVCLVACAARAIEANPMKNAKVGDFAAYKMTTKMAAAGGMSMDMESKRSVIAKTDTEVTIETVTKVMGHETKTTHVVKLDEKFDPREMMLRGQKGATFKELDKGEETLTIAGKALKTNWTSFEITGIPGQQAVNMKGKAWTCPDVPLGGLVKSEMDMGGHGTMTMELVDYSGK